VKWQINENNRKFSIVLEVITYRARSNEKVDATERYETSLPIRLLS